MSWAKHRPVYKHVAKDRWKHFKLWSEGISHFVKQNLSKSRFIFWNAGGLGWCIGKEAYLTRFWKKDDADDFWILNYSWSWWFCVISGHMRLFCDCFFLRKLDDNVTHEDGHSCWHIFCSGSHWHRSNLNTVEPWQGPWQGGVSIRIITISRHHKNTTAIITTTSLPLPQ